MRVSRLDETAAAAESRVDVDRTSMLLAAIGYKESSVSEARDRACSESMQNSSEVPDADVADGDSSRVLFQVETKQGTLVLLKPDNGRLLKEIKASPGRKAQT